MTLTRKALEEMGLTEEQITRLLEEETQTAKEAAARAYFESKGITGDNVNIAMRCSVAELAALELDGENIKDTAALDALIAGVCKPLVMSRRVRGCNPASPPVDTGRGYTKADIIKMSYAERVALYQQDPGRFREIMRGR